MHNVIKVTDKIFWIGANDRRLKLFENHFPLQFGVSYNSYFIDDCETAVLDTADGAVLSQYFENLEAALAGRPLNYLIVQHMEPDHCAGIAALVARHPEVKIVLNGKTVAFLKQFFPEAEKWNDRFIVVTNGQNFSVGNTNLTFVFAPMVHWPEVMVTYDSTHKVLFSADAFGSFGAINGNIFNDHTNMRANLSEYRRYYTNIVGKYGMQTAKLLRTAADLEIKAICPLHGLILREDFAYIIEKYTRWASYTPEDKAVMIAFASMYHHTENAVELLAAELDRLGVYNMKIYDVSNVDCAHLVAESFRVSHLILAAPTYMNDLYPQMAHMLHSLQAHGLKNRQVALIGNGSWAPQAVKLMRGCLENMAGVNVLGEVEILSSVNDGKLAELKELAGKIVASLR
ncbi:MAG: FprA family A-type flavoprotein [bacterium]|nr:FprA family A-type flavoprotein [bacterium]